MNTKQSVAQSAWSIGLFGMSFIPRHRSTDDEAPWQADERCAREAPVAGEETDAGRKRRRPVSRPRVWITRGAVAALALTSVICAVLLRH